MRFTESKKRAPWLILFVLIVVILGFLALGFCGMSPTPKMVHKTIVFEAD